MALVATTNIVYVPTFDGDTGTYIDGSPFKKGSRKNPSYECRCKLDGKSFTTKTQFDAHCKTQTHKNFIQNYEKYFRDVDKTNKEIKDLKVQWGKCDKLLHETTRKLYQANEYLQNERDIVKNLQQKLRDYQDREIQIPDSESEDDEFQDC